MAHQQTPKEIEHQFTSLIPEPGTCCVRAHLCAHSTAGLQQIGWTPLLQLRTVSERTGCNILAKMEYSNPGGSIKDRIARFMVEEAEKRGQLRPGGTILEVTSGNTGISLSMVGAAMGYKVIIRMPRSVSVERQKMIQAYGARLELLDTLLHINQAVEQAEEEAAADPSLFLTRQFSNPDNAAAHEYGTGPEIIRQTGRGFHAFVMGVGTGGTVMGVGRALRTAGVAAQVVAVEPSESSVMLGCDPGCHGIQGLADGFVPPLVNLDEIDRIIAVSTEDSIATARRLHREEGLLVGISSGANLCACERLAEDLGPGKTIVTVLPDRGERYLSVWG